MNVIGRNEPVKPLHSRRRRVRVGETFMRRTVALAIQGMLASTALCGGPAAAQPAARQVTSPVKTQASVDALKREYLRCDRASSRERLTLESAVYCGAIHDELLRREFKGDLDLMLAWWRSARQALMPE